MLRGFLNSVSAREQLSLEGAVEELAVSLEASVEDAMLCTAMCDAMRMLCIPSASKMDSAVPKALSRKQVDGE